MTPERRAELREQMAERGLVVNLMASAVFHTDSALHNRRELERQWRYR